MFKICFIKLYRKRTMNNTFLLFLITILTVSCATTNGSFENPQYEQKCNYKNHKDPNDTGFKRTDIFKVKETNEHKTFSELNTSKINSGIESFQLEGNLVILKIYNKALFEEYTAPLAIKILETHYESRPFAGFIGSIGTLGILPIVAPRAIYELTFGCTDIGIYSTSVDITKKSKTGNIEWRDYKQSHKISISGFDKDYFFDIPKTESVYKIDLTNFILNTQLTGITSIKITCLDCFFDGLSEQSLPKDIKPTIVINHDFRPLKLSLTGNSKPKNGRKLSTNIDATKLSPNPTTGKLE